MAKPLIVANWKMNTTLAEAMVLASGVKEGLIGLEGCQVILCPPSPWLVVVGEIIQKHRLANLSLGSQNIFWKEGGAVTGEVAAAMLKGIAQYVIIGHSERRKYFHESDIEINQKIRLALASGLKPIVCIGEERRPSAELLAKPEVESEQLVTHLNQPLRELRQAIHGLSDDQIGQLTIAYEPIWAISSNKAAAPATGFYANAVAEVIKEKLIRSRQLADGEGPVPVLYGGSVVAANAAEFSKQPAIDGLLVGGASLKVKEFLGICRQVI